MKNRIYCQTCSKFLIDQEREHPNNHQVLENISDEMLTHPLVKILKPIEINSSNAVNFEIFYLIFENMF